MTIFDNQGPVHGRVMNVGAPRGVLTFIGLAIIGLIAIILLFNCVTRIGTGNVGVLTLFGRVTGETLAEGIHVINPLKTVNELSIRSQSIKESASVPSSEGLMMALDTSLIYHLDPRHAAEVFQKLGPRYEEVVIEPSLRSAIREATASHSANALYSGERDAVAKQIFESLNTQLTARGMIIENILLRDIQLPTTLNSPLSSNSKPSRKPWP